MWWSSSNHFSNEIAALVILDNLKALVLNSYDNTSDLNFFFASFQHQDVKKRTSSQLKYKMFLIILKIVRFSLVYKLANTIHYQLHEFFKEVLDLVLS